MIDSDSSYCAWFSIMTPNNNQHQRQTTGEKDATPVWKQQVVGSNPTAGSAS